MLDNLGNGHAKPVLVSTGWLAEHLGDADLVVAEVDENPDLYEEGHIPGAIKLHWREDLQDPVERDIVDRETFERLLGGRGIANATTVVLYGDKNNWFAAYAYWYLKVYGHGGVRILDGGRQKWIDEGRALTTEAPSAKSRVYSARERDESIRAYRDQVRAWLGEAGRGLVDVRSPGEYAGELIAPPGYEQEGAQRAGHIPTAVSIPWAGAVRDDGTFRSPDELRELYAGRGLTPDQEIVAYCRIGERSAHTWFVLREPMRSGPSTSRTRRARRAAAGGGTAANMSEFDVYSFPLSAFSTTPAPVPNAPAPTLVFSMDGDGMADSHGMMLTRGGRYLWVADRMGNRIVVIRTATGKVVDELPLAGALSDDPSPDLLDLSPDGSFAFATLRGAFPLSGDPHASTGSTPGLGILQVRKDGKTGSFGAIARIANVDAAGVDRADPHGLRVRPT